MVPSTVLSAVSVPKHEKAVTSLTEKARVLDKLRWGRSQSAAGCEFRVSELRYQLNQGSLNRNT